MYVEALSKSAIRHMQVLVHRTRHKADKARDRRAEAALAGYLYVLESSVCARKVKKPPVTGLAQKGRIAKGRTLLYLGYSGKSQKQTVMYINALQYTFCIPHSCHLCLAQLSSQRGVHWHPCIIWLTSCRTWYEMCKLHIQRKLCIPEHNIQKRANKMKQSKQRSELAYTSS